MCLHTNVADSLHLFVMVLGCRELERCEKICDVQSSGTSTPGSRVEGERSMVNVFVALFVVLFSTAGESVELVGGGLLVGLGPRNGIL